MRLFNSWFLLAELGTLFALAAVLVFATMRVNGWFAFGFVLWTALAMMLIGMLQMGIGR